MSQPTARISSALGPAARDAAIAAMTAEGELDVLVVGGGVVGVGTALDAVTRGLNTGLLEQRDLASGTSSRSSKLIHGGLRYLEMLDFGLVREALEERGLLLTRLAPHLVRPVPFLYPLTRRGWERPYVGAGLALYDAMAMFGKYDMGLPRHRHLFKRQVARIAPDFKADAIAGAIRYYDCQVDDARLVMTVARTAAGHGAHVATRTKVVGFLREGERVIGVRARDLENHRDFEVRARVVINAAGVWTDEIQEMVGGRGALNVQASKGIHLVVPRDRIRSEAGFIARTQTSVLFVIPWGGTGSSAPPTPPGTSTRRTRPPAGPTSTTSSRTSTSCCANRSTTTTSKGCTPASGRSSPASRSPPHGSPASTPSSHRCRGW